MRIVFAIVLLAVGTAWAQESAKTIFVPAREVAARL